MIIGFSVLGKPVSMNSQWKRSRFGGTYLSADAREWKKTIVWCAMMARREVKILDSEYNGYWNVDLKFYWKDKIHRDPSNFIKIPLDALEGIFYNNDHQVRSGSWNIGHGEPRTEIILRPYEIKD